MIAIKTEVTKQEEKKEKAAALAAEQAQEEEDKRSAVDLEPTEKVELYNQLRKVTFVRPSTDPVVNINLQKDAIKRAEEFAAEFQAQMFKEKE